MYQGTCKLSCVSSGAREISSLCFLCAGIFFWRKGQISQYLVIKFLKTVFWYMSSGTCTPYWSIGLGQRRSTCSLRHVSSSRSYQDLHTGYTLSILTCLPLFIKIYSRIYTFICTVFQGVENIEVCCSES